MYASKGHESTVCVVVRHVVKCVDGGGNVFIKVRTAACAVARHAAKCADRGGMSRDWHML